MNNICVNNETVLDELGRRTACHFYTISGKKTLCSALKDFYAADKDKNDQCRGCVFFKTDEEFECGMNRRAV